MENKTPVDAGNGADALAEIQAEKAELEKRLASMKADLDKAIESRQKAKDDARKSAEERGAYEEAKKIIEAQLAEMQSKYDDKEIEQLRAIKAERDALVEIRRTELLVKIPEGKRDEFKAVDLPVLEKIVSLLPGAPPVDTGKQSPPSMGDKKWTDMTQEERLRYAQEHGSEGVTKKIIESMKK